MIDEHALQAAMHQNFAVTRTKLLNPSILWNTSTLNRWLGPPMFTVQKVFSATPHPQHTAEVSLLIQ